MLWLITPVHGRVHLTRLCLEQRARMLEELELLGVQARQLVVGDDANLAAAYELGFTTLVRTNPLGWRVNEGVEWAVREGGATHIAFCGSDDWHLAAYFTNPPVDTVRTCRWQAFVAPGGDRLAVVQHGAPYGLAPWVIPVGLLASRNYRPARDRAPNGVDTQIAASVEHYVERGLALPSERRAARRGVFVHDESADLLRVVDFKGGGEQLTRFEDAVYKERALMLDTRDPFGELARVYPPDLVERMERFYADKETRR